VFSEDVLVVVVVGDGDGGLITGPIAFRNENLKVMQISKFL
jgi:hypothetical protein